MAQATTTPGCSTDAIDGVVGTLMEDRRCVHRHRDVARPDAFGTLSRPLPDTLAACLPVPRLWEHQARAIDLLRGGHDVVVATGTSSGKSLCYQVPALEAALDGGTALMVYPTKALAHDQLTSLARWAPEGVTVAAYDGDCSTEERNWVRANAQVLVTNPEMLHLGILANHDRWDRFLRGLRLVLVDELHVLRGVFGSHVAHVLRRLRRVVAAMSGREPTFAFTSATIGAPAELAESLCGRAVATVTRDDSRRGRRTTLLWNPSEGSAVPGEDARPTGSLVADTAAIASELVAGGLRTLVFCRSRRATELVADEVRRRLRRQGLAAAADAVRSYRAGYLAEERRDIELGLAEGRTLCVVATNALELGVDIGGLDAVVLSGFPGTVASFRQQVGRAGRAGRDALAVLVAGEDQLDQWMMRHPRELFSRPPEPVVVNPSNPHVLHPHIGCAADELPLGRRDEAYWGDDLHDAVRDLVVEDRLRLRAGADGPLAFWAGRGAPAATIGLRSASRGEFAVRRPDGSLLATVDAARAPDTIHPGAVYLHQGAAWRVVELDATAHIARVEPHDGSSYTQTRSTTSIRLLGAESSDVVGGAGIHLGRVEVTTQVTGYLEKTVERHRVIDRQDLDLPPSTLDTTAVWWVFDDAIVARAEVSSAELPGALHAAEHAGIGILPLFAICDRWDVGGVSSPWLADTGLPTIVIHDAHPGGSGVAPMAFRSAASHLRATLEVLEGCPCSAGCPSCVQSPKCGNGNEPLDKAAAARLLRATLG
jgi:DEAD/DEAH box helicase domain-containing protein